MQDVEARHSLFAANVASLFAGDESLAVTDPSSQALLRLVRRRVASVPLTT
jgi:hypothetical protein